MVQEFAVPAFRRARPHGNAAGLWGIEFHTCKRSQLPFVLGVVMEVAAVEPLRLSQMGADVGQMSARMEPDEARWEQM